MQTVPVLFDSRQQAASNDSFSPSAQKPERVVNRWKAMAFPIEIKSFAPASHALLSQVHNPEYVRGVFALTRNNGFGNKNSDVAASLPWTTGSMLAAAKEALFNGKVACSPTSGFHHAHYAKGIKYCTFNGLLATVVGLQEQGFDGRVGVLDLDAHWADGTQDILEHLPDLKHRVEHYNFGGMVTDLFPSGIKKWMEDLPQIVSEMAAQCDIILYQAGADPHNNDPLGGYMSSEQMRNRDRIVFEQAAIAGTPVAWNLAGGYQYPFDRVLDLHNATMQECIGVFVE